MLLGRLLRGGAGVRMLRKSFSSSCVEGVKSSLWSGRSIDGPLPEEASSLMRLREEAAPVFLGPWAFVCCSRITLDCIRSFTCHFRGDVGLVLRV